MVIGMESKIQVEELKNVIILTDLLLTNNLGISYYNDEYFEYVSGAFRPDTNSTTEITLKFKKDCYISVYYGQHSSYSTVTLNLNGTSILPPRNYTQLMNVKKDDILYMKMTAYYGGIMMLFNPDYSVMHGNINF